MKRNNFIIISIIVAVPIFLCSIWILSRGLHQDDWKKRTTPLPKETRDLLCSRFGLSQEDVLCSGKDIYALDFMPTIQDTFKPYETYHIKSSEAATYEEVEEKIGTFKYECEQVVHQADGLSYFRCFYDLRGDKKFIITIFYTYPEEAVMRLGITNRFDDD